MAIIKEILSQFEFKVTEEVDTLVIISSPPYFLFAILGLLTPFIVFLGIWGNTDFLILLLPIFAVPFINDGWKFPTKISFDSKKQSLKLVSPLLPNAVYSYKNIKHLSFSTTTQSAGTSPFEEGNQEIAYRFYLETEDGGTTRLLKINTRKDAASEISEIINLLNSRLNLE